MFVCLNTRILIQNKEICIRRLDSYVKLQIEIAQRSLPLDSHIHGNRKRQEDPRMERRGARMKKRKDLQSDRNRQSISTARPTSKF